jgi:aryl-alcohol dehydrogenase-like predicted oxidoreductase
VHPIAALQSEYSLWSRDPEDNGVLAACRDMGTAFVAYSPLGRGFLTGRWSSPDDLSANDWRRQNPRFQGDNFRQNLALVEHIKALATTKGCTPAQLALAWLLQRGDDIVPIPGTTKVSRLRENAGSVDIALTAGELQTIDDRLPLGAAEGERYDDSGMKMIDAS